MRFSLSLFSVAIFAAAHTASSASLAISAHYWSPSSILTYNPNTDPTAPYNVSTVPLAVRIGTPTAAENAGLNAAWNVNANARAKEGRVQPLIGFSSATQGALTTRAYAPTVWQYMDTCVNWGGAVASIITPAAQATDAAHRNGVPMLGTVFLAPTVYGGNFAYVNDFLKKTGNTFPVADKMIQVARYFKFDGYFINTETEGGNSTTANTMRDFLKYFRAQAPELKISWYDSMVSSGNIAWQRQLNDSNKMFFQDGANRTSDQMFLDFYWGYGNNLPNSRAKAISLGRDPYDVYAGIDTEGAGFNGKNTWGGDALIDWDRLFPPNAPHNVSLGLYRPDWTSNYASDYISALDRELIYWSGQNRDPSNTPMSGASSTWWGGIAKYIPTNTAITSLPFVTNFNIGQGTLYRINGTSRMSGAWTNLSVQDILPTWKWLVQTAGTKTITPSFDFTDPYYGGSCLLVTGSLTANVAQTLKLYQTSLPISSDAGNATWLRVVFKPASTMLSRMQVAVAFQDDPTNYQYVDLDAGASTYAPTWNTKAFNLTGLFPGKQIVVLGIRFLSPANVPAYTVRIGRIGLYNTTSATGAPPVPNAPTSIVVDATDRDPDNADVTQMRVRWTASTSPVYYYNVYSNSPTGVLRWLGATPNTYFAVPAAQRATSENSATLMVEAVGPASGESTRATTTFNYMPAMNLNNKLTGTIIGTAGSWSNQGDVKEKAMDGNTGTAFDAQEENGAWVGLDLGSAKIITAVRFFPRTNFTGRIVGGKFQGSNSADFSNAVTLATVSADPGAAYRTVAITDTGAYRYVRYLGPDGSHGNIAELAFYGSVPTFQAFLSQYFTTQQQADPAISGPEADPAKSGAKNLLSYASGVNPMNPDRSLLPTITTSGTNLTLTYTRLKYVADVTYTVEVSSDMVTWQSGASFTTQVSSTDIDDKTIRVVVRDNTAMTAANQRFIRLKITQ
jgi:mannosyl-glycoprotein endo-beta-N-acetylglucosaminidase